MRSSLLGILRSPVLDGYRNKSEFSIGLDVNEKPTVGFNIGLFKEGLTAVSGPENCRHISPIAKTLASALQSFIRSEYDGIDGNGHHLPVWNKSTGTGFWRLLTVREGGVAPPAGHWVKWKRTPLDNKKHTGADAERAHVEYFEPMLSQKDDDGLPSLSTEVVRLK